MSGQEDPVHIMKIAQVAPLLEAVPPRLYGGTERVVAHLCDALVELGHDVTLFSSADARTRAHLIAVRDQAIRLDQAPLKSDLAAHVAMLHEVRRLSTQFDVLHFHLDLIHFAMFEHEAYKTVTTLHGRLDLKDLSSAYERWPQFGLVSISNDQRRPLPDANWLATAPHGLPPAIYQPQSPSPGDYLAFLGRISPEKRPDVAVRIAQRAGIPLKIAAKVDRADTTYYEAQIKPLLDDPRVEFVGEIGDAQKSAFLSPALALLMPIDWPEPFGLAMIEAMACGVPVIVWNRGAAREIIEDGVTGYVVESEEEALAAIRRVHRLDRRRIRREFEERFSSVRMARTYVDIYEGLLSSKPLRRTG